MAGLLSRLLDHARRPTHAEDASLRAALERAAQKVEPRLRHSRDFPRRLEKPVAHALEYVRGLAQAIPGPVEMSPERFGRDPFVHTLFGSVEQMQHALCMSQAMHEYARRPGGAGPEAYALMGMRRRERLVFGMDMVGEVVRREVAQQVVSFTDHTLSGPAPTEAEARQLLAWNLFDSLLARVAGRLEARRGARQALAKERDDLTAELRRAPPEHRPALEQRLKELLGALSEATLALDLRRLVEDFHEVLLAPERYLRLEQVRLRLDAMGVVRSGDDPQPTSHALDFTDLVGRDRRRWTVVLVHCHPRPELLSMADRLHEASRWLEV